MLWQDSRNKRSRREYGRVIDISWDYKYGWWDVWVAFFGFKWPSNGSMFDEKPYVLRYLETALKPYVPKTRTGDALRTRRETKK